MLGKEYGMKERIITWIVWRLPNRMVYWCAIRLMAKATQGEYGNTEVPGLTAMDALERW